MPSRYPTVLLSGIRQASISVLQFTALSKIVPVPMSCMNRILGRHSMNA